MNTPETVNLLGNALCLDFANSVDWAADGEPSKDEVLHDPDHLRRWGVRLGIGDSPPDGAELRRALELRAALHHALVSIAAGDEPDPDHLATIRKHHARAAAAGHLTRGEDDTWRLDWHAEEPGRVRYAVAMDAVGLLADAQRLDRVRHCPGHDCGWLFLDLSGRRRWCSMDTCGSRAKMRRMYERRRAAA
jgi:predicted RNA-binding Zn ribbon-like protein